MELIISEEYEQLGIEFQYQIILLLNDTLKKHQVDEQKRKEICGNFIFNFSMLLDQGDIKDTIPILTFERGDKLFLKNGEFEYHEYAYGNVDEVFQK